VQKTRKKAPKSHLSGTALSFIKRMAKKAGQSPGTLIASADVPDKPVVVRLTIYNAESVHTKILKSTAAHIDVPEGHFGWLEVIGLSDVGLIERLGRKLGIHVMTLEDVANTGQRPRFELDGDMLGVILNRLISAGEGNLIGHSHVALFLGPRMVVSFLEHEDPNIEAIHERMKIADGRLRQNGSDYLFYRLMDVCLDQAFTALDKVADRLDEVEAALLDNPDRETLVQLQLWRRNLLLARKVTRPIKELVVQLMRQDVPHFKPETRIFLNDLSDHTSEIIETIDLLYDLVRGFVDLYYNAASDRLNAIMKTLSVVGAIFLPLTFIAGIFGMNFVNMPGLDWAYGYHVSLGAMVLIAVAMMIYFKRRNWW
jgi:magnesium transporter